MDVYAPLPVIDSGDVVLVWLVVVGICSVISMALVHRAEQFFRDSKMSLENEPAPFVKRAAWASILGIAYALPLIALSLIYTPFADQLDNNVEQASIDRGNDLKAWLHDAINIEIEDSTAYEMGLDYASDQRLGPWSTVNPEGYLAKHNGKQIHISFMKQSDNTFTIINADDGSEIRTPHL